MARFDVYRNPGAHAATTPFLLDVQSEHLAPLNTRVVVPLRLLDRFPDLRMPQDLMPVFDIDGQQCFLDTPKLAAVPWRELGAPVDSLKAEHDRIVGALDRLFGSF
ncbi:CcdB family protein [Bordetella genomosp. 13]|uniref:Toxin CcdB n=1 Tax=Bordetella genomosp. 13 TaxID=463040 RepID=A0A1W6ZJ67_9BORD|nr:CcdB family protein [Bordetella genomosp. 13]ARP97307.1 plasmid maintenance protein CcdB [Bordetella genomosp. 13]